MNRYRWGNGFTTTLPLEVFTQRNVVEDSIRLKLNFIQKETKIVFDLPFGDLEVTCVVAHSIYSSLESSWSSY